jgi:hypothetical protein
MLVTVYKDSQSSFLGADDDEAIRNEAAMILRAGLKPNGFAVEVPWSPEGGAVLALLLVRWRNASPTRSVVLTFENDTATELMNLSPAEVEWELPTVKKIAIIDLTPSETTDLIQSYFARFV